MVEKHHFDYSSFYHKVESEATEQEHLISVPASVEKRLRHFSLCKHKPLNNLIDKEQMRWKHGECFSDGNGSMQLTDIVASGMKRNRRRRRTELETGSRIESMCASDTFQFLQHPLGRLSRALVVCCFMLQVLPFVADGIPKTSAFVPHSHPHVSRALMPSSAKRRISQPSTPTSKTTTTTTTTTTAIFGIRGFRQWFGEQFPNAVSTVDVTNHSDTFDHVLIDTNQILHFVLRRSTTMEGATKCLMNELNTVIKRCKPTQSLVLAIDGSPPAAKIATQRKRRVSTLKNTAFKMKYSEKMLLPPHKVKKRLRNYESEVRALNLTPGTEYIQTLESALLYWAWQGLQNQGKPSSRLLPKVKIYICSSRTPGEGETKLLEWINNFRSALVRKPGQSIAMIGGDSDLVLEAMVIPPEWTHNIFVFRPEDNSDGKFFKRNNSSKTKKGKKPLIHARDRWHCTSVWEFTLTLDDYCRNNIPTQFYNPEKNPEDQSLLMQIRTDMVLLIMLNGNDYFPRMVAVDFRSVLKTYLHLLEHWIKRNKSNKNVGLIDPNTLNYRSDFCADFFRILGDRAPSVTERRTSMNNNGKTYTQVVHDMGGIGFMPTPCHYDIFSAEDTKASKNAQGVKIMQLSLGTIEGENYHQYRVEFTSKEKEAKEKVSEMALEDFGLLEGINESYINKEKHFDWELEVAAEANTERYIAGLIWTLQTYQDGICPTYHYNYGKCRAPTGRAIASYFSKAMDENRNVGATELLGNFEPGGSISAGVACLAALPLHVKEEIVPKPYSLVDDKIVEDIYAECMSSTDNFFEMKKFETLIEAEIRRLPTQMEGSSEEENKEVTDKSLRRKITLGDHYWTVLERSRAVVENQFEPPPPPVKGFARLRPFNRLKVSRFICMDLPRSRSSIENTIPDSFSKKSNYPRSFWKKNNITIDYLSFGSLINGSGTSILEMPYKVAFGASPKKYGPSRISDEKSSFKLLKSDNINLSRILNTEETHGQSKMVGGTHGQSNIVRGKKQSERAPELIVMNPEDISALVILTRLRANERVKDFTFSGNETEYFLTVSFDEANGGLPLEEMSFSVSERHRTSKREQQIKCYLASLALDAILYRENVKANGEVNLVEIFPEDRWYNLTFEELSNLLMLRYPVLQSTMILHRNPENSPSSTIFKQLCDVRLIKSFDLMETATSEEGTEKWSLSVRMDSPVFPEELLFERKRRYLSKKFMKEYLMSQALDAIIMASPDHDNGSAITHWYDLSFTEIKNRISRIRT